MVLVARGEGGIVASAFSTTSEKAALAWLERILERRGLRVLSIADATEAFLADPLSLLEELDMSGLTAFQRRLYRWLAENVPWGGAATYGEVARALGTSPRAVGRALAANPFPPIIPCHRVVSARSLGGFSGPPEEKRNLIMLERSRASSPPWRRVA